MGNQFSSLYKLSKTNLPIDTVTVPNADTTIFGSGVIWNLTTPTAARTITVATYDRGDYANFDPESRQVIIIRSKVDCSVNNVTIANAAGTVFTFATNDTSAEKYCVLKLTTAGLWELA
jgi:hypothetical protein